MNRKRRSGCVNAKCTGHGIARMQTNPLFEKARIQSQTLRVRPAKGNRVLQSMADTWNRETVDHADEAPEARPAYASQHRERSTK